MENKNNKIITRFAPSPTGNLHIGSVRSALFSYLFAKKNGGKFILRIEDTDKERSAKEFEENILQSLDWLDLEHDEFYRQSERVDIYKRYLEKLITDGKAYVSKETPSNAVTEKKERSRTEVIRFKNPNKKVTFTDLIRGEVSFDTTDLGDFVIAKDLETPLFHLVVVIDDHEMGVTHLIRGEDHISNTPRQILIQEAINAPRPIYAHLPLVLGSDKSKLSKRHGALSVLEYKKLGYLPDALINFLALIGWNPGGEKEIFNREELIDIFLLEKVQKGGAIFNTEKLDWVNKQHILKLSEEKLFKAVKDSLTNEILNLSEYSDEKLKKVTPFLIERISKFNEITELCEVGKLDFYFKQPDYEAESLFWKKDLDRNNTKEKLDGVYELLSNLDKTDFGVEKIKEILMPYADEQGRGNVLWPLRYALSGKDKSPDPFSLTEFFGKEESLKRIKFAIEKLK